MFFPAVLPAEQSALEVDVATQLVTWVREVDAVEIQSYMEEQWGRFRRSNTFADEKPQAVHRAAWSRAHYYVHLRQFLEDRPQENIVFESLQNLLSTGKFSKAPRRLVS